MRKITGKVHRVGTIVCLGTGPGERDVDEGWDGWDIRASAPTSPTVQCLSWASSSSASRHHRIPMHGARDAIYICEYDKGFMKWMGECARYLGSLVVWCVIMCMQYIYIYVGMYVCIYDYVYIYMCVCVYNYVYTIIYVYVYYVQNKQINKQINK